MGGRFRVLRGRRPHFGSVRMQARGFFMAGASLCNAAFRTFVAESHAGMSRGFATVCYGLQASL